jgi:hypothetical protein
MRKVKITAPVNPWWNMWGQDVHSLLRSTSQLLKIYVDGATDIMCTDDSSRNVPIFWHSESGLSLNTAATYTQHGKRVCWHTCGLHRTRQAHVLAHQWPTQNMASVCVGTPVAYTENGHRMCWHSCDLRRKRQAHVLAHLWLTQKTANECVGTAVTYSEHGKRTCW